MQIMLKGVTNVAMGPGNRKTPLKKTTETLARLEKKMPKAWPHFECHGTVEKQKEPPGVSLGYKLQDS